MDITKAEAGRDLDGRRFYSPGAIAGYCLVSLPVGLGIYGLNAARRGSRVVGFLLAGSAVAAFVSLILVSAAGDKLDLLTLKIFVAIGLLNVEWRPYHRAIARGGSKARWWPPLAWAIAVYVATAFALIVAAVAHAGPGAP